MSPEMSGGARGICERALLAIGLVLLGVWGVVVVGGLIDRNAHFRKLPGSPETTTTAMSAIPPKYEPRAVIGRIEARRMGLSAVIREGTDAVSLWLSVGHVPETARPGESGNIVLAGHRDTWFRPLMGARDRDTIRIVTSYGHYDYEIVSRQVVERGRVDLIERSQFQGLTLVTCYPFRYLGPAPRRFVVRARPIGECAPGTPREREAMSSGAINALL